MCVCVLKSWSCHDRWQVFRGASKKKRDLLFKLKRSSSFGFNTLWRVNLAANKTIENKYDFKIKGGYKKRSIKIYKGDTSIVVAQVYIFIIMLASMHAVFRYVDK